MKRYLRLLLLTAALAAMLIAPAGALEFTLDAPEDYLFGRPTSQDTVYEVENPNVDRSKNTALIPPGFGTPTSYLPGSGEYLVVVLGRVGGEGVIRRLGGKGQGHHQRR